MYSSRKIKEYNDKYIKEMNKSLPEGYKLGELPDKILRNSNVEVICPKHGKVVMSLRAIVKGSCCKKCSRENKAKSQTTINDRMIKAISQAPKDFIIGKLPDVIKSSTVINVTCPKHGEVSTGVNAILNGNYCKHCSRKKVTESQRKSREQHILECKAVHGDKYDYSLFPEKITSNKVKVPIVCKTHGVFHQRLNDHKGKSGCNRCHHHGNIREGYIMQFTNGDENFIKFGIAVSAHQRCKEMNRTSDYDVKVLNVFNFSSYEDLKECETHIRRRTPKYVPELEVEDGFTELTYSVEYNVVRKIFKAYGGVEI